MDKLNIIDPGFQPPHGLDWGQWRLAEVRQAPLIQAAGTWEEVVPSIRWQEARSEVGETAHASFGWRPTA